MGCEPSLGDSSISNAAALHPDCIMIDVLMSASTPRYVSDGASSLAAACSAFTFAMSHCARECACVCVCATLSQAGQETWRERESERWRVRGKDSV